MALCCDLPPPEARHAPLFPQRCGGGGSAGGHIGAPNVSDSALHLSFELPLGVRYVSLKCRGEAVGMAGVGVRAAGGGHHQPSTLRRAAVGDPIAAVVIKVGRRSGGAHC